MQGEGGGDDFILQRESKEMLVKTNKLFDDLDYEDIIISEDGSKLLYLEYSRVKIYDVALDGTISLIKNIVQGVYTGVKKIWLMNDGSHYMLRNSGEFNARVINSNGDYDSWTKPNVKAASVKDNYSNSTYHRIHLLESDDFIRCVKRDGTTDYATKPYNDGRTIELISGNARWNSYFIISRIPSSLSRYIAFVNSNGDIQSYSYLVTTEPVLGLTVIGQKTCVAYTNRILYVIAHNHGVGFNVVASIGFANIKHVLMDKAENIYILNRDGLYLMSGISEFNSLRISNIMSFTKFTIGNPFELKRAPKFVFIDENNPNNSESNYFYEIGYEKV